ncbi:MAG: prepilin peptidase [Acidobacteriota bacterium]
MLSQPMLDGASQSLLGVLVMVAAVYDVRRRRIPNWLTLGGIVAGFGWNACVAGAPGLTRAATGLALGFLLYFPLYLLRARGAGDVKLLAAVGAIAGAGNCFWVFVLTAVLGGVIALALVLFRGRLRQTLFNVARILRDMIRLRAPYRSSPEFDVTTTKGLRLPHGALIAVGTAAFLAMLQYGIAV